MHLRITVLRLQSLHNYLHYKESNTRSTDYGYGYGYKFTGLQLQSYSWATSHTGNWKKYCLTI